MSNRSIAALACSSEPWVVDSTAGLIASPNHPAPHGYATDVTCVWIIQGTDDQVSDG